MSYKTSLRKYHFHSHLTPCFIYYISIPKPIGMYEFIEGEFVEKSPAHLIVKADHLAYYIHISVFTYSQISNQSSGRIYLHFVVREDAQMLYGFSSREEREIFKSLSRYQGWVPIRHD